MCENTDSRLERRAKQELLKTYYGEEQEHSDGSPAPVTGASGSAVQSSSTNRAPSASIGGAPENIDGVMFNAEVYLEKMLREKSLGELMSQEHDVVRDIRRLDNEMQTLVYENYNKFIVATNTIHQMKNDFKQMGEDMTSLSQMMEDITQCSASINDKLDGKRKHVSKLASVHSLLMKLQFLFELPSRLKTCIEQQEYPQAVRYYIKAHAALERYKDMPSFQGIHADCGEIVNGLKVVLKKRFNDSRSSAKQLAECVDLLYQLNEPTEQLCYEFLSHARLKLDEGLKELEDQNDLVSAAASAGPDGNITGNMAASSQSQMDILEFMDHGCNGFLADLCVVIATFNDLFMRRRDDSLRNNKGDTDDTVAQKQLLRFVMDLMDVYIKCIQRRVDLEQQTGDNAIFVRALDRFHRRLQAMNKLLPDTDFARIGTDIVASAAKSRCAYYLKKLNAHFTASVTDIRQNIVAPKTVSQDGAYGYNLAEMLSTANTSIVNEIKAAMRNLQAFIDPDITFSRKPYFRDTFCKLDVREGLVVGFLEHLFQICEEYCEVSERSSLPATLLLILSHMCLDMNRSSVTHILSACDEQFAIALHTGSTYQASLCATGLEAGRKLLEQYVHIEGLSLSQMLRKSVETRDWLNTIEPRNVRPVMKRVIEDLNAIDQQVGQLYEEGPANKERSSDSSKRTFSHHSLSRLAAGRSNWQGIAGPASTVGNSLISNIQKIFADRIDIFGSIDFNKSSVLMGIIKISLKSFLESIRLRTFGKFGLQQIQVDIQYLNLHLWRFAEDENLVYTLLDEILSSAVHRCCEPVLMEQGVIDVICDREQCAKII